jgi:hypothetical protein
LVAEFSWHVVMVAFKGAARDPEALGEAMELLIGPVARQVGPAPASPRPHRRVDEDAHDPATVGADQPGRWVSRGGGPTGRARCAGLPGARRGGLRRCGGQGPVRSRHTIWARAVSRYPRVPVGHADKEATSATTLPSLGWVQGVMASYPGEVLTHSSRRPARLDAGTAPRVLGAPPLVVDGSPIGAGRRSLDRGPA